MFTSGCRGISVSIYPSAVINSRMIGWISVGLGSLGEGRFYRIVLDFEKASQIHLWWFLLQFLWVFAVGILSLFKLFNIFQNCYL